MQVSRRSLLQSLGTSAAIGSTAEVFSAVSAIEVQPSSRCANRLQCSILLDHNENAYGVSEKVLALFREVRNFSNRYPRTDYEFLVGKIADLHGVKPAQVALGCGSSEILRMVATEFLAPSKNLVQAAPTCPLLGEFARTLGAEVIDVSLTNTYSYDLDRMLTCVDNSTGLVHICNPNNPTGMLTRRSDIEAFVSRLPAKSMVLIDEAYYDFVSPSGDVDSFRGKPFDDPRVIVVRTFSKMYGLAGMPVGYAVAAPEIIHRLSIGQFHIGIGTLSARAAAAALDDVEYVCLCAKRNADDRQEFVNQVNARFLHTLDSHTNFFMLDPMRPTDQVVEHFKNHNIYLGPIVAEMPKYIRVSLGTPVEMKEFWRVLDLTPSSGTMVM